jgi:hypothetical protein
MPGRQGSTASRPGDEAFVQLNGLLHQVRETRAAAGKARQHARQVLRRAASLVFYLRRLPVLHVEVSDSTAGHDIASALTQRLGMLRATTAAGVLELPERPEAYLVGRSRQAVRTGMNHARREGLSVLKVTDEDERRVRALELAGRVSTDFGAPLKSWAAGPRDESWFVVDPDGNTLAVAITMVDPPVARLSAMISAEGRAQSPARYLLSARVFMDLIGCGVSHVILEGSLFLPPGLLHFQTLLGFRPMNIRLSGPHPEDRPSGGRKLRPVLLRSRSGARSRAAVLQ